MSQYNTFNSTSVLCRLQAYSTHLFSKYVQCTTSSTG